MRKLRISIKKELLQILSDKVGLSLMFLMPLVLVILITVIQDSAYNIVNENKISLLVVNKDKGDKGERLINSLAGTNMFQITIKNISTQEMREHQLEDKILTGLYLPENFSKGIESRTRALSSEMLADLGLEGAPVEKFESKENIVFTHDPTLRENYVSSLKGLVQTQIAQLENESLIENIYGTMEVAIDSATLKNKFSNKATQIETQVIANDDFDIIPNSTQHNVPAWTIFAMFFMVVSLGSNIVKEKNNGSFVRLKTIPTNFSLVIFSKMLVYQILAILQVFAIFSVGMFLLPKLGLPTLVIPANPLPLLLFVFIVSFTAVCYSILIGAIAKTQEQANGFGALSVVILAALGGIWVPVFIMPEYIRFISGFSPLYWCLEGFYTIFLKGGGLAEIQKTILFLMLFNTVCLGIASLKLKTEKLI